MVIHKKNAMAVFHKLLAFPNQLEGNWRVAVAEMFSKKNSHQIFKRSS